MTATKEEMSVVGYQGLAVIVPTRNRAELAMNAIRSVLGQPDCDVRLLVSDNSTRPGEVARLSTFCQQLADERVHYLRPARPLPMQEHWDWAIEHALQMASVNHFTYLTDRMIFKPDTLRAVAGIVATYPDRVVSYNYDTVHDDVQPIHLEQDVWTGRLFELSSAPLLRLSAQIRFPSCLPRMLNCWAPRALLESMRARFGNVFTSIAPDYNFCYRCLDMVDSILYYDQTVLVNYGLLRSNGVALVRGQPNEEYADFISNLGPIAVNFAAPLPDFRTVRNAVVHEYCMLQRQVTRAEFPVLDYDKYLTHLCHDVASMQESPMKREMEALLAVHGLASRARIIRLRSRLALGTKLRSLRRLLGGAAQAPAGPLQIECASAAEALAYACRSPRAPASTTSHLGYLRGRPVSHGSPAAPSAEIHAAAFSKGSVRV